MDFVDSFTRLPHHKLAPQVQHFYHALNAFLDCKSDDFLHLWYPGEESVLYFNLNERERGGEKIKATFRQIRAVLSRVPVGTTLHPVQVSYHECGDLAYAVTMEKAVSELDNKTVVSEHRSTLVWRKFEGEWKLVHLHSDTYDRRQEVLSELLRGYHPDA